MQDPYHSPSFEQQFRASLHQQPTPQQQPYQPAPSGNGKSKKPLFIFLAIVIVAVIIPITLLIVLKAAPASNEDAETKEHQENVYDQNTIAGNLNDSFKAAAEKGAHAAYKSVTIRTRYSDYQPAGICEYMGVKGDIFKTPTKLKYTAKVETLNANALNYYLDLDRIVTMSFLTKDQTNNTPTTYVIYAADYEMGFYYVFSPDQPTVRISMNQSDLFDDVKGIPDFYITDPTGGFL